MSSKYALGGFASGLASGLNQGVNMAMQGQQYRENIRQRRALDAYSEHGDFDPAANIEPGEGEMGPMPPHAGQAWQQWREERSSLLRKVDPRLALINDQLMDEQHKHLIRTSLSLAGVGAASGNGAMASEHAGRLLQLMFPDNDYRVTAGEVTGADGKTATAFFLEDGTPLDIAALKDAYGLLDDPVKWEATKADVWARLEQARATRIAAEARTTDAGFKSSWDAAAAYAAVNENVMALVESGQGLPEAWFENLDESTKKRWFGRGVTIPPPFLSRWRGTATEVMQTMQEGTTPDDAIRTAFMIEAALLGEAPGASAMQVEERLWFTPDGREVPVLMASFGDGEWAVFDEMSSIGRRLMAWRAKQPSGGEEPPPPAPTPAPPQPNTYYPGGPEVPPSGWPQFRQNVSEKIKETALDVGGVWNNPAPRR